MATENNGGADFWGTNLINPDKSAAPLLEQLCLGLARITSTLEPSTTDLLVPQKIAAFYRVVGGNYDSLFLATPNLGISLIYRSLGCFHSLQPSPSPFEPPNVPALLPNGFVRWLTVQLLLDPDEHVAFLQEALKRFDVINQLTGTPFPKTLPRQAFAEQPDKAMTKWHEEVSKRLEQEHQNVKFRRSPNPSPRAEMDRREYLSSGPHPRRPSRSSRHNSREQVMPALDARRRSLPDQNLGFPPQPNYQNYPGPTEDQRFVQSYPVNPRQIRGSSSSRHRDSSTSARRQSSSTRSRPSSSSGPRPDQMRPGSFPPQSQPPQQPSQSTQTRHHHRKRSSTIDSPTTPRNPQPQPHPQPHPQPFQQFQQFPSAHMDGSSSSGSDASSETSSPNHVHGKKPGNLFPPTAYFRHHQRRHSADPSFNKSSQSEEPKPPLPPRPVNIPKHDLGKKNVPPPPLFNHVQGATLRHRDPFRNGQPPTAKFNGHIFEASPRNGVNISAPSSPSNTTAPPANQYRHVDPKGRNNTAVNGNIVNGASNGTMLNGSMSGGEQIKTGIPSGIPFRHPTVSGARGRRYVTPEAQKPKASSIAQPTGVGAGVNGPGGVPKLFTWD